MTNLELLRIRQRIDRRLLDITQALEIAELKEPDMAVSTDAAALITAFDAATDAIASRIQRLVAQQTGMSADDKAAFQAEIDKLNLLGQDPNNPVPPAAAA